MSKTKTAPPGKTRFEIPFKPRDGSRHFVLSADTEEVIVPSVGDSVGVDTDSGITGCVMTVNVFPTCDPMVYVVCKSLFPQDCKEADEIVTEAKKHGWRVQ